MTLGNLWQMVGRQRRLWMLAGTAAVLGGLGVGMLNVVNVAGAGNGNDPLLMALMFLPLAGGCVVSFAGETRSQERVRVLRDWNMHPLSGKILWLTALVVFIAYTVGWIVNFGRPDTFSAAFSFLFLGIYFTLLGWGSMLMSTAASYRRFMAGEVRARRDDSGPDTADAGW
ncbi:hypothetical protein [Arthrobacter sp. GMC3]|uniref:hypothetical protein n=1 Tax=Arthrobacter sp. GMC3 TaxID=2058894 RepID=UPI000CE53D7D|nr:hypothetical protein [Arthrobacter sp. GMC3]